jgi:hypothetical protein
MNSAVKLANVILKNYAGWVRALILARFAARRRFRKRSRRLSPTAPEPPEVPFRIRAAIATADIAIPAIDIVLTLN